MNENAKISNKIIRLINKWFENVDIYYNDNSTWLIHNDTNTWVVELTKSGVLWYNYIFFKKCFNFLSIDVIQNQCYITEWVESFFEQKINYTLNSMNNNKITKGLSIPGVKLNDLVKTEWRKVENYPDFEMRVIESCTKLPN